MRILIIGSGGREHALAWKIARSDRTQQLFCAPGNGGTESIAENVNISATDVDALCKFASDRRIDLTVVGPEESLCLGIVDRFTKQGLPVFGPTAAAARLEGDKTFAKKIMRQAAIPMAEGRTFCDYQQAREYIATRDIGLVVKAAGLAKGKGVAVCDEPSDALLALEKIMVKQLFGAAGKSVVVEEKLEGEEISVQALVDEHSIYLLEPARDYKRAFDNDEGPNTGGMGAYSPATLLSDDQITQVYKEILVPIVDVMKVQGCSYKGVLYAGLMLTVSGPKVLEFNCRFGDPETQVLMPRLKTDLVDILEAVNTNRLDQMTLDWLPDAAVCVVAASEGYPGTYPTGKSIRGLEEVEKRSNVTVFHAGTSRSGRGIFTEGGRVLGITATGSDLQEARTIAYEATHRIHFEGMQYRRDIARSHSSGHEI